MQKKNQFSIIGTGAVGGYYGGLLQRAGFDVHFLVRSDYKQIKTDGLRVDSVNGNFTLPDVQAYNDPSEMPTCNVVIVALKTTANAALKKILPRVVGEHSLVLTLQNGLGGEAEIADIVGADRILAGLCFLCSNKIGPGHISHLDYGMITLGEYRADGEPGGISSRLNQLNKDLQAANIPTQLVEDLALARWKKLVWNIPFNGMSVACDCLTDELVRNPEKRLICEKLMHETAAASNAVCRPIEPDFLAKMIRNTEKMKPYAPSMKLDFDRGNPMEIEAIYGHPIRAAEAAGVNMPETKKLYEKLKKLNPAV
ncbi:putative 2-dehydropantoate 2-reductase [Pontiella agarivorans]|uniref:2-dehydropantoate 2-reductase n=1 Tax=Pontiella agarivorans TaxID=3038953 RepID=A0ABU5MUN8_9BACT|nr:putative 2-dehydropantoate 2-reductase [Pontiella agarivorans]MDZ8117853.1 putative 2-dehydropantoate 2-reductase [Pontiella agarivorans]